MNKEYDETILNSIKNSDGIIVRWPRKKEKKSCSSLFDYKISGKKEYTELEINMILKKWHSFGDHSLLRRELYDAFLLDRTPDCKKYWVHKKQ